MGATSLKMGKSENQCDFPVSEKRGETTFFEEFQNEFAYHHEISLVKTNRLRILKICLRNFKEIKLIIEKLRIPSFRVFLCHCV